MVKDINEITAQEKAFIAANAAEDKKAIDTQIIDIRNVTDFAEYLIVTSGDNQAQLKAIANSIEDTFSKMGMEPEHVEGKHGSKWILYDYGDLVIHIIDFEARAFYGLEEFWGHAMTVGRDEWLERVV